MNDDNDTRVEDVQDITAALRAGIALGKPRTLAGFKPFVLTPGGKVVTLEAEDENPPRIKASPVFDDPASLVAYFNNFKDSGSILFGDIDNNRIVAILDGHMAETDTDHVPRYCDHRATYQAKHSPEWLVWLGMNGKGMKQAQFATFVEDNAPDIKTPAAADVYEMATNLEAKSTGEYKSAIRQNAGSVKFQFTDDVQGSANGTVIPKQIELMLRPYMGCDAVRIIARFRYRIESGNLVLWYDLLRVDHEKRAAFDSIVEKIAKETATQVYLGKP